MQRSLDGAPIPAADAMMACEAQSAGRRSRGGLPRGAWRAVAILVFGAFGAEVWPGTVDASSKLSCAEARGWQETGTASWYGRQFDGDRTASGETFDTEDMTAAHPRLPFGTRVKVTNLRNGRSATFTINDRGPFVGSRIIDVSRRGAAILGFRNKGTARVRVEAVETDSC